MGMSERQDFLNWKINKGMYGWSHECAKLVDEAYERGKTAREQEGGDDCRFCVHRGWIEK